MNLPQMYGFLVAMDGGPRQVHPGALVSLGRAQRRRRLAAFTPAQGTSG
jgi:hypothetical protein